VEELGQIVKRSARILNVGIEDEAAEEIARRARGTPRVANRILKRIRDFAQVKSDGFITKRLPEQGLRLWKLMKSVLTRWTEIFL